ncbi:PilN domain-containing protein [Brevibacillus ginsengisoli]|uniref:PilN domain-containing protein n=1 Tax=Brevibacillus ginsengisoli TaxID=363854 RepID=UPI003CF76DB6
MSININLLPKTKPKLRQIPAILIAGMVVIALGGYYLYHDYTQAVNEKQRVEQAITEVKKQKDQLTQEIAKINRQSADQPDISRYLKLPEAIRNSSVNTDFLLDQLSKTLPKGGIINSVEFQVPDKVKVSGRFSSIEEAVAFLEAIKANPVFRIEKVGSVGKLKQEASEGLLTDEGMAASVYTISAELIIQRNTP